MKITTITLSSLIIVLFLVSCTQKQKEDGYTINGVINKEYKGYVKLYQGIKLTDSAKVENGIFQFIGKVKQPTNASIFTEGTSAASRNFFIENATMDVRLNVTKRTMGESTLNWIIVESVGGTLTEIMEQDFLAFKTANESQPKYANLLYDKLDEIISKNPNHPYSGSILQVQLNDTILSRDQGIALFEKLDKTMQDEYDLESLDKLLYPPHLLFIGKTFEDFAMYNSKNELINTKSLRNGNYLFIDFWASWCPPCLKEVPKLKEINKKYSKDDLQIIGISIDTSQDKWLKALEKYQQPWTNLLDTLGEEGQVAKKYKVSAIPFSLLINPDGKITETGLYADELEQKLDSIFNINP